MYGQQSIKTSENVFDLKTQFVPRSKHSVSVSKPKC